MWLPLSLQPCQASDLSESLNELCSLHLFCFQLRRGCRLPFFPSFWAPNLKPACPVSYVVNISGLLGFLLFILTSADVSNFTLKGFLILLSPSLLLPNTSEGVCSVASSLLGVQGIFIAVHLQSETTRILRLKY